jgi:hypothetical protein
MTKSIARETNKNVGFILLGGFSEYYCVLVLFLAQYTFKTYLKNISTGYLLIEFGSIYYLHWKNAGFFY